MASHSRALANILLNAASKKAPKKVESKREPSKPDNKKNK